MKIHFLGSTIEKQKKDMRNQFDKLEAYVTRIAKGEKPFDITEYQMDLRWCSFTKIRLAKTHSIKPYFLFFADCIQNIFTKTCPHAPEQPLDEKELDTVTISPVGIIEHDGKHYWSITSAVLRNQTVKVVNPVAEYYKSKRDFLSIFIDDEIVGYAEKINMQP